MALSNHFRRLQSYLSAVGSAALASRKAGRELTVFPQDIFLVSYLRSGSTWVRFLFGNLLQDEPVTFENVSRIVPVIDGQPDRVLRKLPRILKSHESFDPRYPRVIHIVRDPRDIAVSFYYYNIKVRVIPDGYPIDEFVERFVVGQTVDYADRLGCWEDHTLSWMRMRGGFPMYHRIRYEDLIAQPEVELAQAAPALGMEFAPDRIQRAVALSSADRMRSLEQRQAQQWGTTKGTRQDIPFVREASSGGWQKRLSAIAVSHIENAWGKTMEELGYELSSRTRVPEACGAELR